MHNIRFFLTLLILSKKKVFLLFLIAPTTTRNEKKFIKQCLNLVQSNFFIVLVIKILSLLLLNR